MKRCVILRGTAGVGKSTFCDLIAEPKIVCCADFFFEKDGGYNWDGAKLREAHEQSVNAFKQALLDPHVDNIIVANTNCKERDFSVYIEESEKLNIPVTVVVLEKRHSNNNLHGVPDEVIAQQEQNLRNSLKLK